MAYEKTNWIDNETKVSAAKMNKIEEKLFSLDANKVDKDGNKVLSTEDYTSTEKAKVANLPDDTNAQLAEKAKAVDVYTKQQVDAQLAEIDAAIGAPPSTLTTDAKTVVPAINELKSDKVDKVTGKGLSTNDYTTTEKNKLAGIPADTAAQLADIEQKVDVDIPTQLNDKVQNFKLKNEVVNGDFSNGTTGWTNGGLQSFTVVGVEAIALANSQFDGVQQTIPLALNNRYYFKADVKATSNLVRLGMSGNITSTLISHSGSGNYERLSGISIPTTDTSWTCLIRDYRTTGFDNYFTKNVLVINLTAIFGAGNEPTKEEMDRLVSMVPNQWWDGELDLTQQQYVNWLLSSIREKANKAQEGWITPSLVNGATHSGRTLQYRLNDIGQLEFRGELSTAPSVLATTIFSVSGKYLPKTNNGGIVSRNNAFARVQISLAGNFSQISGATIGPLNVDGLVINIG